MGNFFKHFKLLLTKSIRQHSRRKLGSLFEILIPLLLFSIIVWTHTLKPAITVAATDTQAVPLTPLIFSTWTSTIHVSPNVPDSDVKKVIKVMEPQVKFHFVFHNNSEDAEEAAFNDPSNLAALIFDQANLDGPVDYTIRFPARKRFNTAFIYPPISLPGPRGNPDLNYTEPYNYLTTEFAVLQHLVETSIIKIKLSKLPNSQRALSFLRSHILAVKQFPYPEYLWDPFAIGIKTFLPLIMTLAWTFSAVCIVRDIVREKELRLREILKMMGVRDSCYALSWLVKNLIFMFPSCVGITLLLKLGDVINYVSFLLLFTFVFLHVVAIICFCFLVSTFCSRSKVAAAVSAIVFFGTYIPFMFLWNRYDDMSWIEKAGSSIFLNTGMSFGLTILANFQLEGKALGFNNINTPSSSNDNFTILHVFLIQIFNSLLYLGLSWYINNVFPGEFGLPRPWYFPIERFLPKKEKKNVTAPKDSLLNKNDRIEKNGNETAQLGLSIKNLRKVYANGKEALTNMNIDMYEGQITGLLGQNGAGKTTTISILTGLYPPTSGTATVNGYDIETQMDLVRNGLGLCPQFDVLFDLFTVGEHLKFYCRIKNVEESKIDGEINTILKELQLEDKIDAYPTALSGGMRRKLCVGISLIGGSKTIILDEPTAGMDPCARRFIWDLLLKYKAGRTLIITTHYMDEADLICDRIAIMVEGNVKACGTSSYLKNKLNSGHNLTLVKSTSSFCDINKIENVVKDFLPHAKLSNTAGGGEITFHTPTQGSLNFEDLFGVLEQRGPELGITSFGVSIASLEDVFLKICKEQELLALEENSEEEEYEINEETSLLHNGADMWKVKRKMSGPSLYLSQFKTLLYKRFINSLRDVKAAVSQLLMPVIFAVMAMLVCIVISRALQDEPSRTLSMAQFGPNVIPVSMDGDDDVYKAENNILKLALDSPLSSVVDLNASEDMSSYLLNQQKQDQEKFLKTDLLALSFENNFGFKTSILWYNNQPLHAIPTYVNLFNNNLLRTLCNISGVEEKGHGITVRNHPLPQVISKKIKEGVAQGFSVSFMVSFGMSFLSSSFILFIVSERATKSKHLQFIAGVEPYTYWLATYFWDLLCGVIPSVLVCLVFLGFQSEVVDSSNIAFLFLLLVLYVWAMNPVVYLISYRFEIPASAYAFVIMLSIFLGIGGQICIMILRIPNLDLLYLSDRLYWVFLLFPSFCLGQGVNEIYNIFYTIKFCRGISAKTPFSGEVLAMCNNRGYYEGMSYFNCGKLGIGRHVYFMLAEGFFYMTIVILIEYSHVLTSIFLHRFQKPVDYERIECQDEDVIAEKDRVQLSEGEDVVRVIGLEKVYDSSVLPCFKNKNAKAAVDSLSFGVSRGELFGLLGTNGAGKTSTFKMLSGDILPSSGEAYVDGYDVVADIKHVQKRMGYCPQYNALIDSMTAIEILSMYASLRGVHKNQIKPHVYYVIKKLGLQVHAKRLCGTYSGGNKRKLCTAIALVGSPPIVYLDEPTAGMDPAARRLLWNVLSDYVECGNSILLTSHSMEECEALCHRLVIMVKGKACCIGSIQHLKTRFGNDYNIMIKTNVSDSAENKGCKMIRFELQNAFSNAIIEEEHGGTIVCRIPKHKDIGWKDVFRVMETIKQKSNIENYSVSETSLEQIFLQFAQDSCNAYQD